MKGWKAICACNDLSAMLYSNYKVTILWTVLLLEFWMPLCINSLVEIRELTKFSNDIVESNDMYKADFGNGTSFMLHSRHTFMFRQSVQEIRNCKWRSENTIKLGPDSTPRCRLTSIGNPIVKIRRSYNRLISTMGFPILVKNTALYWVGVLVFFRFGFDAIPLLPRTPFINMF